MLHISNDGDLGTSLHNAEQLVTWMDPLILGSGDTNTQYYNNSGINTCNKNGSIDLQCKGFYNKGGPLGNAYKIQTGWCKDGKTPRWTWINNIPDGELLVPKPQLVTDMINKNYTNVLNDFTTVPTGMKGLIPGILEDITDINPLNMLKAVSGQDNFFQMCPPNPENPDCCGTNPKSGCSFCAPPSTDDEKESISSQIKIANYHYNDDSEFAKKSMSDLLSGSAIKEPYENYSNHHKYELILMLFIIFFIWIIIFKIKK